VFFLYATSNWYAERRLQIDPGFSKKGLCRFLKFAASMSIAHGSFALKIIHIRHE